MSNYTFILIVILIILNIIHIKYVIIFYEIDRYIILLVSLTSFKFLYHLFYVHANQT